MSGQNEPPKGMPGQGPGPDDDRVLMAEMDGAAALLRSSDERHLSDDARTRIADGVMGRISAARLGDGVRVPEATADVIAFPGRGRLNGKTRQQSQPQAQPTGRRANALVSSLPPAAMLAASLVLGVLVGVSTEGARQMTSIAVASGLMVEEETQAFTYDGFTLAAPSREEFL